MGIVAFVQIIYAGWIYLTAAGNTTKTGDAMKKISNAILGIVLLFSSYIILNTINPDLVGGSFGLPDLGGNKIEKVNYDRPDEAFSEDEEFTLVRGRVVDSSGQPLANVKIFDDNRTILKSSFLAQTAYAAAAEDGWCLNGQACFPSNDGSCPGTNSCSCNDATIQDRDGNTVPINVTSGGGKECRFAATGDVCRSVLGAPCEDGEDSENVPKRRRITTTTNPASTTTFPPVNITITPGKGTLKIGQTNANGDIVFNSDFMNFLSGQFPNDVLVKDASKTILLPKDMTSISGGLTARYEWRNIKKTKTIVSASLNGQTVLDFSNVITTGLETTTTTVINQSTTTTIQQNGGLGGEEESTYCLPNLGGGGRSATSGGNSNTICTCEGSPLVVPGTNSCQIRNAEIGGDCMARGLILGSDENGNGICVEPKK